MSECRSFFPPSMTSTQDANTWRSIHFSRDGLADKWRGSDKRVYRLGVSDDMRRLRDDAAAACTDKDLIDWLANEYIRAMQKGNPDRLMAAARALQIVGEVVNE